MSIGGHIMTPQEGAVLRAAVAWVECPYAAQWKVCSCESGRHESDLVEAVNRMKLGLDPDDAYPPIDPEDLPF